MLTAIRTPPKPELPPVPVRHTPALAALVSAAAAPPPAPKSAPAPEPARRPAYQYD